MSWTALVLVILSSSLARAQPTLGPEVQANTYTTATQRAPAVAMHGDGSFVVVWDSGVDYNTEPDGDDGIGVFMQRFDGAAARVGVEQHVNTFTTADQVLPEVGALGGGAFVVTWSSGCFYGTSACGPDGSDSSVALQRFDAAGAPAGGEWLVNTFTLGFQSGPDVAASADGEFVVTWGSSSYAHPSPDRDTVGVFGQRFAAGGLPVGGEMAVNTYTSGNQGSAAVAMDDDGAFVAVWGSSSDYSLNARGFAGDGTPFGEFAVTGTTTGVAPVVAATGSGEFVIVWEVGFNDFFGRSEIHARRFEADGTPLGSEFTVNSYAPGDQTRPAVAADAAGNFVVTWRSKDDYPEPSERDSDGIFAQAFAADGTPLGSELQVNASADGPQVDPAVAAGPPGRFVVAWADAARDDVFARQLSFKPCTGSVACADGDSCTSDACESGVCLNRRQPGCCRGPADCDDREPCTDDVCSAGTCTHAPVADCTVCSRHFPCFAAPKTCTTVGCNEVLRRCEFIPIAGCCIEASDCDDGLTCTIDTCSEDHACGATPIDACVDCTSDADCAAGCLITPETCESGRCETPAVCPIVTLDAPAPIGRSGKLLVRVEVHADTPGSGKVKAVATGTLGAPETGDAAPRACREGAVVSRARAEVVPGGGSNLRLALTRQGARCLAADPDGTLPVDVRVRVKRKKTALADVEVPRVWRR